MMSYCKRVILLQRGNAVSISPAQCRAARALLSWSQEELATKSRISKKTIADFERDVRLQHGRTTDGLQATMEASGVEFIAQNGGGEGVRFRLAMPRFLFRRDDVPDRQWVAFAFDYKGARYTGFVAYDALTRIALDRLSPVEAFDRDRDRILLHAADQVDAGRLDAQGQVMIHPGDLKPIEFDAPEDQP